MMPMPFSGDIPTVIVPVTNDHVDDVLLSVTRLAVNPRVDMVELRLDCLGTGVPADRLVACCAEAVAILGEKPCIATFRTAEEGGETAIAAGDYVALKRAIVERGRPAYVDVEYNRGARVAGDILACARAAGVRSILSSHDFRTTDPASVLLERLEAMRALEPDVVKLAVMPQGPADVLELLSATVAMKERHPGTKLITMSMGGIGAVSRLVGGLFGSVATFGTTGRRSAPGQVELGVLREGLEIVHEAAGIG